MGKTAILAVKIIGDATSAQQAMAGTEKAAGGLSKLGGMAGTALAGAAVAAGAFAVKLGVDSVKAAADLEQSTGAVEAVFKSGAGQMKQFSDQAATSVGLTKNEYNELATVMGSQLKNGGTSLKDLGGKTNELIKTGSDLAAMFGGSTSDAVGALSSALKGERDPIEKYGVSLSQAKIDAEAAAMGFQKVGGSLSAEANQAATLSLIMKQTKDAHGAFGRETDTLAHKQQVLGAQWGNLKTTLGNALLPVVSQVMGAMVNLMNQIGPIAGPALARMSAALALIGQAAGPIIQQFSGQLVPALQQLWTTGILPLVTALRGLFVPLFQMLATVVVPAFLGAIRTVAPAFLQLAQSVAPFITALSARLIPIIRGLMPVVTVVFAAVSNIIRAAMTVVTAIIRTATAVINGNWSAAWAGVKATASAAWALIKSIVSAGIQVVKSVVSAAMPAIRAIFTAGWNAIRATTSAAMSAVRSAVSSGINAAKSAMSSGVNAMKSAVSSGLNSIKSLFSGLKTSLVSSVTSIGGALRSAGSAIVSQLAGGITAGVDKVKSAMSGVMSAARNLLPHSPAKEGPFSGSGWGGWGESINEQLAYGLDRSASDAIRSARQAVGAVAKTLSGAPDVTAPGLRVTGRAAAAGTGGPVINITVQGALDPVAVARQIQDILFAHSARMGR